MLKLSIILALLASVAWRTTPTNCRQTGAAPATINQLVASNVQNYMDATAKPCENFYQYACGRWYQQHIGQLEFGDTLGLLDYELNKKLEQLLKRATGGSTTSSNTTQTTLTTNEAEEPSIYQKVRTYYRSCKKVKPYNLKKYLQLIQPCYESGWYILARNGGRNWQVDKFDWLAAIAKLRLYGLNGVLLKEEVLPRWDEAASYSIYLDKPNLAETVPMGEGEMIELLLDIGQTKRVANELARQVNAFEVQLHRLQELEDEEGAKEMQLGYLQEYMPQLQWLDYIKQLRGPTTNLASTVIIQNIPYMRALVKLLQGVERSTVCNYIMLKFLHFLKQQGPAEISKQECIGSLRRAMPLALSYIIGEHFYRDAAHNDAIVQRIFEQLKQKFYEIISDNRLQLDPPIIVALQAKLNGMRLQVGNSPRNISPEYYDAYYERAALDASNFYVNQLSLLRLAVEKSHEHLEPAAAGYNNTIDGMMEQELELEDEGNTTYVLADWLGSSSSPFYVKPRNLIIVPYGFLQMPVYHRSMQELFKYAALGFTLAHELLHGFDSSGIEYDHVGNIMGPSEAIVANQRFVHGLRCMQNELVAGARSLNEKLADYEGLRLVYETFFNGRGMKRDDHRSKLLPQYSNRQLFFISFAQFFCGKEQRSLRQTNYLEHAADELRVMQALANFEEFSREFGCERRTKMQSKHRCRLW